MCALLWTSSVAPFDMERCRGHEVRLPSAVRDLGAREGRGTLMARSSGYHSGGPMASVAQLPAPQMRDCASCGSPLVGRRSHARFCSGRCRAAAAERRQALFVGGVEVDDLFAHALKTYGLWQQAWDDRPIKGASDVDLEPFRKTRPQLSAVVSGPQ